MKRPSGRQVRVREPQRTGQQVVWTLTEDTLPPDHPARRLWDAFGACDLRAFSRDAKAVRGVPGRSVRSPRMKLTLWGYAMVRGIVSAREIARRCHDDLAFRWIVGDMGRIHHSTLSDFRVGHRDALGALFDEVLTQLVARGALRLPAEDLAVDGMRIRADASAASFRDAEGLAQLREQVSVHVRAVMAQAERAEADPGESRPDVQAALNWQDRVAEAERACAQVAAVKARAKDRKRREVEARASSTDPDARWMKMPEKHLAPAYNAQFGVVGDRRGGPRTVVAFRLTQQGTDAEALPGLSDQAT
jgi:transposase